MRPAPYRLATPQQLSMPASPGTESTRLEGTSRQPSFRTEYRCPRRDSNSHLAAFETVASAGWATRANSRQESNPVCVVRSDMPYPVGYGSANLLPPGIEPSSRRYKRRALANRRQEPFSNAAGGIRTPNLLVLSERPLPIGLQRRFPPAPTRRRIVSQSLYGSISFSPAIATPKGVSVCRIRTDAL